MDAYLKLRRMRIRELRAHCQILAPSLTGRNGYYERKKYNNHDNSKSNTTAIIAAIAVTLTTSLAPKQRLRRPQYLQQLRLLNLRQLQ